MMFSNHPNQLLELLEVQPTVSIVHLQSRVISADTVLVYSIRVMSRFVQIGSIVLGPNHSGNFFGGRLKKNFVAIWIFHL